MVNAWRGLQRGLLASTVLVAGSNGLEAKEFLVKFKSRESAERVMRQKSLAIGTQVLDAHAPAALVKIRVADAAPERVASILSRVLRRSDVDAVSENIVLQTFSVPNDPKFPQQWALAKVRATEAWDVTTGSRDVVVAVIDTGVDATHRDLAENMWHNPREVAGNNMDDDGNGLVDDIVGWDFLDNDANPHDETSDKNPGHGTHCAGIIGAVGNNNEGVSGIAQDISIMALRFIGPQGQGDLMAAIKAIDYAANNGAHIISASWGGRAAVSAAQPLVEAMQRARDKGVLFVAAAGNDGVSNDTTSFVPANVPLDNVIAVAASNNADSKPQWSNFGARVVSLSAPGEGILSTIPGEAGYRDLSGTSMATPLVSGLAGLMLSQRAGIRPTEIKALLQTTGTQVAIETACKCRVSAADALMAVESNRLTVVPAAAAVEPGATLQLGAIGGSAPYKFALASGSGATVQENGVLQAGTAEGAVTVKVTDQGGTVAQSLTYIIAAKPVENACPLTEPLLCQALCLIQPDLPWCSGAAVDESWTSAQ